MKFGQRPVVHTIFTYEAVDNLGLKLF